METSDSARLVNSMRHLMWHIRKIDTMVISKYDLHFNEYMVFRTIAYRQPVNPKMLTEKHRIYYSNLTGIIDKLVERGYVLRRRDDVDRRVVCLELSACGKALKDTIEVEVEMRFAEAIQNLSPDMLPKAIGIIEDILKALQEEIQ